MPSPMFRSGAHLLAAAVAAATLSNGLMAQPAAAPTDARTAAAAVAAAQNSDLDAQLFYQLLIGEIELRSGEASAAYEVMLDAARRSKDPQLFRRATDIALQGRAGDQALTAARAWRSAIPSSLEAHRTLVQLLLALNRPVESAEPLKSLLELTPPAERSMLMYSLPRLYSRSPDQAQAATLLEQAYQPYMNGSQTYTAARVSLGRAWLAASNPARAMQLATQAQSQDSASDGPSLLALEMMPSTDAEALVVAHLAARPDSTGVRFAYIRSLSSVQRYVDAIEQLKVLTAREPRLAPPWLSLGALQLELRQPADATRSLQTYASLLEDGMRAPTPETAPTLEEDEDAAAAPEQGLTQAYLLLSQSAEMQQDYSGAAAWLEKIDNTQQALEVQTRRASLLMRQGRLQEARELIRNAPEKGADGARAKITAEAALLRDAKRWSEAHVLLAQANDKYPDDVNLLYDQSMAADKLDRLDEMERLLRRVIALKPDHHHAYNALGYSLAERNLRLDEARTLIQKALELSPGEPFITDSLGWVEFRLGNRAEALRLLRAAYQARPDTEIAAHLGEVLWTYGQRDEAVRIWREGRQRDGSNEVLRDTLTRLQVEL